MKQKPIKQTDYVISMIITLASIIYFLVEFTKLPK